MSLDPNFNETSFSSESSAKFSIKIIAFNRCPASKSKTLPIPKQLANMSTFDSLEE